MKEIEGIVRGWSLREGKDVVQDGTVVLASVLFDLKDGSVFLDWLSELFVPTSQVTLADEVRERIVDALRAHALAVETREVDRKIKDAMDPSQGN